MALFKYEVAYQGLLNSDPWVRCCYIVLSACVHSRPQQCLRSGIWAYVV